MVSCGQCDPAPTNALVGENLFWVFIWMKPNSAPIGVLVDFEEKPRFIFFHVFFLLCVLLVPHLQFSFLFFHATSSLSYFFFSNSFCDGAHWCVFGVKGC